MAAKHDRTTGIRGGVRAHAAALRGWTRHADGRLVTRPLRCKREEWYLARARPAGDAKSRRVAVLVQYLRTGAVVGQRCLWLHAVHGAGRNAELLGWLQTPKTATHLQLCVPGDALPAQIAEIAFHNVSERDPKCHPLANVPRWSTYRTPFTVQRVVLPNELRGLAPLLGRARSPRDGIAGVAGRALAAGARRGMRGQSALGEVAQTDAGRPGALRGGIVADRRFGHAGRLRRRGIGHTRGRARADVGARGVRGRADAWAGAAGRSSVLGVRRKGAL